MDGAMHPEKDAVADGLSELDRRLLSEFQDGLPLTPDPFTDMATRLGVSLEQLLGRMETLRAAGVISRVGPVFRPHRIGTSTLAAQAIPVHELERVAALVNGFAEVNHNYEREHAYNLWFVVNASDAAGLDDALRRIEQATGYPVLRLPLLRAFHIDLGFPLQWN